MKPGDLRIVPKPSAWGECYCCRKIYALEDLRPVDSAIENDWRYICKFCLIVAKRPRKTKGEAR